MPDKKLYALHPSITEIGADAWDQCAGADNPFISYGFLSALEESGSVGHGTGWLPRYLTLLDTGGQILAVAPAYVKLHSYGEYVFDHAWADAFERAGGDYYPKLQVCAPFSPVPGPRLLRPPDSDISFEKVGDALIEVCQKLGMSSAHISFCTQEEWAQVGRDKWLKRLGTQFHWHNKSYESFDAFLLTLSSSHRKSIRRERRDANNCGLVFKAIKGAEIKEHHWDAFYRFYQMTIDRKWGSAYLTRDFFSLLSEKLGDKVLLMLAEYEGLPVAGALNLVGSDTLYGRNWGCEGEWPFLHFELCYYRAIEYAIEHKLKRVEAGAQGAHKIQRGYLPRPTYSLHWFADHELSRAVADFLQHEQRAVEGQMESLITLSPFKDA